MDTSTTVTHTDVRTFTGRSVDEILPRVRAELGADAIVLRRREGLAGGVAGFFQRPFAEVDARPALPDELPVGGESGLRNDRATAEGLASPAIQALVEQASPFAEALQRAQGPVGERAQEVLLAAAQGAAAQAAPVGAGLYGPQPNAFREDDVMPANEVVESSGYRVSPASASPADPGADGFRASATRFGDVTQAPRPTTADAVVKRLVASGLSEPLAADVVAEAVAHGLPFAQPRALKKLVRTALARRLNVMADLGDGPRTLAFVGAGGAGKSAAIAHLAAAYAAVDAEVVVVALRSADGGCSLAATLEPLGVSVVAAADAEQAARRLARRRPALTLVDTPAAGPGDRAAIATLAADLRALGVEEIHLTLPATLSAAAGDELAAALAPLGITHVALTHTDQTARPGAPVELAITGRRALSYASSREGIEPADPSDLARRLLP